MLELVEVAILCCLLSRVSICYSIFSYIDTLRSLTKCPGKFSETVFPMLPFLMSDLCQFILCVQRLPCLSYVDSRKALEEDGINYIRGRTCDSTPIADTGGGIYGAASVGHNWYLGL